MTFAWVGLGLIILCCMGVSYLKARDVIDHEKWKREQQEKIRAMHKYDTQIYTVPKNFR